MKENVFRQEGVKKELIQCLLFSGAGIGLMIYSLYYHGNAGIEWVMSPYLFPLLISIFLIFLAVGLLAEVHRLAKVESIKKGATNAQISPKIEWKKLSITLSMIIIYYFAMPMIGFLISGFLFLVGMFWLLGERRIWLIALLAVGTPLILYGVFHELLHVMLP